MLKDFPAWRLILLTACGCSLLIAYRLDALPDLIRALGGH